MSSRALADRVEASSLAKILINHERKRTDDKKAALKIVARSIGVSPGTIENITRSRLKKISAWLRDALRAKVIRELEMEMVRLRHEIDVLKQAGVDPRSGKMAEARADLSLVAAALGHREDGARQ